MDSPLHSLIIYMRAYVYSVHCTRLVVHQFPKMHARVGTVLQYMPTLSYNRRCMLVATWFSLRSQLLQWFLTVTSWWCYR